MQRLWISLKRGFIRDPKHRRAVGECVWLFEYMLDIADWTTGMIEDWKDADVAIDMGMPVSTIRDQRRKLDEAFYIHCTQKQYSQTIKIYNWINPRNYAGEVINPRPSLDLQGEVESEPSNFEQGDTQGDTQGNGGSLPPTSDSKNQTTKQRGGELAKIKTSLLLANIPKAIDPMEHGVLTIQDAMRKKSPAFVLGWLAKTCHGKGMSSPIGFLTSKLKGADDPDPFYVDNYRKFIPEGYLEAVDLARYICPECDPPVSFKKRRLFEEHMEAEHEEQETAPAPSAGDRSDLAPIEGVGLTPTEIWESILGELKFEVPAQSFQLWLRDTKGLDYKDRTITVSVFHPGMRDIIEDRFTRIVERKLTGILNDDAAVEFVVANN